MKIGIFAMGTNRMAGGALLRIRLRLMRNASESPPSGCPNTFVLIDQYASKYPYSQDGQLPAPTDAPILDPFLALMCMASATRENSPRYRNLPSAPSTTRWCSRRSPPRSTT